MWAKCEKYQREMNRLQDIAKTKIFINSQLEHSFLIIVYKEGMQVLFHNSKDQKASSILNIIVKKNNKTSSSWDVIRCMKTQKSLDILKTNNRVCLETGITISLCLSEENEFISKRNDKMCG